MEKQELEILRLREQIIKLETKNNLLQMNHKQREALERLQKTSEEFEVLDSQIKVLKEEIKENYDYIEHLEHLLEFFVYKDHEFSYTQAGDNSPCADKMAV